MASVCALWSCDRSIRAGHVVCREHWDDYSDGALDECPECGRLKDSTYEFCLPCNRNSGKRTRADRSKVKETRTRYASVGSVPPPMSDGATDEFYVYICETNDGAFYVGQTNDIRSRMWEHKVGKTKSLIGKAPRLVWFSTVRTRADALAYEKELTRLKSKNERPIRRMVTAFRDVIKEVSMD